MRALTLMLVVLAASVSAAVASPLAKPSLKLSPNPVKAGHTLAIKGSADGCPVGDTVTVISHAFPAKHTFAGVPAVLAKVRAGGLFHTSTTIPAGKRAGVYTVTARCGGGNLGVLVRLHVAH
jgi:Flp pilus assembly protein CpaB